MVAGLGRSPPEQGPGDEPISTSSSTKPLDTRVVHAKLGTPLFEDDSLSETSSLTDRVTPLSSSISKDDVARALQAIDLPPTTAAPQQLDKISDYALDRFHDGVSILMGVDPPLYSVKYNGANYTIELREGRLRIADLNTQDASKIRAVLEAAKTTYPDLGEIFDRYIALATDDSPNIRIISSEQVQQEKEIGEEALRIFIGQINTQRSSAVPQISLEYLAIRTNIVASRVLQNLNRTLLPDQEIPRESLMPLIRQAAATKRRVHFSASSESPILPDTSRSVVPTYSRSPSVVPRTPSDDSTDTASVRTDTASVRTDTASVGIEIKESVSDSDKISDAPSESSSSNTTANPATSAPPLPLVRGEDVFEEVGVSLDELSFLDTTNNFDTLHTLVQGLSANKKLVKVKNGLKLKDRSSGLLQRKETTGTSEQSKEAVKELFCRFSSLVESTSDPATLIRIDNLLSLALENDWVTSVCKDKTISETQQLIKDSVRKKISNDISSLQKITPYLIRELSRSERRKLQEEINASEIIGDDGVKKAYEDEKKRILNAIREENVRAAILIASSQDFLTHELGRDPEGTREKFEEEAKGSIHSLSAYAGGRKKVAEIMQKLVNEVPPPPASYEDLAGFISRWAQAHKKIPLPREEAKKQTFIKETADVTDILRDINKKLIEKGVSPSALTKIDPAITPFGTPAEKPQILPGPEEISAVLQNALGKKTTPSDYKAAVKKVAGDLFQISAADLTSVSPSAFFVSPTATEATFASRSTGLTIYVTSSILTGPDETVRKNAPAMFRFWLDVFKESRQSGDFCTAFAILGSFASSPLKRVRSVVESDKTSKTELGKAEREFLFKNQEVVRQEIETRLSKGKNTIPLGSMVARDTTFAKDGSSGIVEMGHVISQIEQSQMLLANEPPSTQKTNIVEQIRLPEGFDQKQFDIQFCDRAKKLWPKPGEIPQPVPSQQVDTPSVSEARPPKGAPSPHLEGPPEEPPSPPVAEEAHSPKPSKIDTHPKRDIPRIPPPSDLGLRQEFTGPWEDAAFKDAYEEGLTQASQEFYFASDRESFNRAYAFAHALRTIINNPESEVLTDPLTFATMVESETNLKQYVDYFYRDIQGQAAQPPETSGPAPLKAAAIEPATETPTTPVATPHPLLRTPTAPLPDELKKAFSIRSGELQQVQTKKTKLNRGYYLHHKITPPPVVVGRSAFVSDKMLEQILTKSPDAAGFGIKFDPKKEGTPNVKDTGGSLITIGEGLLGTFATPIIGNVQMCGDYYYDSTADWDHRHSCQDFGDPNFIRRVIISTAIHPDFETNGSTPPSQSVFLQLAEITDEEVVGQELPQDFQVLSDDEKKTNPKKVMEYDQSLINHLVFHLTTEHRRIKAGEVESLNPKQAEALITKLVTEHKSQEEIRDAIKGKAVLLNGHRISMEIMYNSYVEQLTNEFSVLEAASGENGYIYTIDPPAIFARQLGRDEGPHALNLLQCLAFQSIQPGLRHLQQIGIGGEDGDKKEKLLTLYNARGPSKDGQTPFAVSKTHFQDSTTHLLQNLGDCSLVLHSNGDGFYRQNIKYEAPTSLDGVIGSNSNACLAIDPKNKNFLTHVIP